MDLSVLLLDDIESVLKRAEIAGLQENKDPRTVLIRIYLGSCKSAQIEVVTAASRRVISKFKLRGITVIFETFTNDHVKNTLKWSVNELIDCLLAADIHVLASHLHQGNMAKTAQWNIGNLYSQADRLRFHLGFPMGQHVHCPVLWGDLARVYEVLGDLCPPFISSPILNENMSPFEVQQLQR